MNVPALELQEFLTEYGKLILPEHRVLRGDFFCHREDPAWRTVLISENEGQQLLCNGQGHVLGRYDRITPLFLSAPVTVSADVQDLLEQLSGLRSRVPKEDYEHARDALNALASPAQPLVPAYLVMQQGQAGIVAPDGRVIVPAQYAQIQPFPLTFPGNTSVFLCRKNGHQLNPMDIYDWNGNCIFRQINNLLPREETLLTPPDSGRPIRKVKSLWVIRQDVEFPFPENPDFQSVREIPRRYTIKELRSPGSGTLPLTAMTDTPFWAYCPPEETPPKPVLLPLAAVIGETIGCCAEEVIARLSDYRTFRKERTPLSVRLANVTADTPLDQLGLSIRAYHCLVRRGLQTAADLMALSEEAISHLPRSTAEITQEITALHSMLAQMVPIPS